MGSNVVDDMLGGWTQQRVNGTPYQMLGGRTSWVNDQDQIVQSSNYSYSSFRVVSIDEVIVYNRRNPIYDNAEKLKKTQSKLTSVYLKEQTEYIQDRINKIRDSVEDRQSRIAWQTVNEVSRRKSAARTKLKAASQEERIHMWKQHFKNLLGKSRKLRMNQSRKLLVIN